MHIEFITGLDNVINDWVGGFSPREITFIKKYSKGPILHLFSGMSEIGDVRVDLNPKSRATIIMDVFDYIQECFDKFNTILLDPIYCSENRVEIWKEKYGKLVKKALLYVYPYDTRRTKLLYEFFKKQYPLRIIIKAPDRHIPENYVLYKGLNIEVGAYKPNRCIWVYQAKNERLI